jgi:hypothetical protein
MPGMPTYTYQVLQPDQQGEIFEVEQRMSEPALSVHPRTGQPVQRIIVTPPALGGSWGSSRDTLSDANLARNGFTKYVKTGQGTYDKTAGSGPAKLG